MKNAFLLAFVLTATASSLVHSATEEFIWFENSKNIEPIDLSGGHAQPAGISWSYAVDCNTQSVDGLKGGSDKLFLCRVDESAGSLLITLLERRSGSGTVNVRALGRDSSGAVKVTQDYSYLIKIIHKPSAAVEECPEWDCALYNGLFLGVEGTSVSEINNTSNVRIQYSAYSQLDGFHMYGSLMQSSLQEQAVLQEGCSPDDEDCEVDATVGGRLGLFFPANDNDGAYLETVIRGPYVELAIQKLDSTDAFVTSYYAGYRFAYSKIRYFSLGLGKTENMPGKRLNITGQLPLYNDKIIAGVVLNMAIDDEAEERGLPPGDSLNVYAVTKVDFTKIFEKF
jgi:hypothetical protein